MPKIALICQGGTDTPALLAQLNQIDWSIRAFEVAAELAPDLPYPHRCLAMLYRRAKGDAASARKHQVIAQQLRAKMDSRAAAGSEGSSSSDGPNPIATSS